jgi:carbon monoxide dehydrogenase subunit G
MQFAGTLRIAASRERVWAFLTDPQAVGRCVPDLERLDEVDPTHFQAVVKAGIGVVRGRFTFDIAWQELTAHSHARMTARGKTPGSAVTIDSSMRLTEIDPTATELAWSADVVVHGTIASVGARLMSGFAEKQTDRFYQCIQASLEADPE